LPVKHTATEINLTPKHVMQAAAIIQPTIVVGLHFPIQKKIKEPMARQIEFIKKLEYNVPWAFDSAAWHKKLCSQVKFFIPIQCYDLEQLDIFFSRIDGLYFDGVSMPIRGMKIWEIALFFVKFYQLGITRVHLLGTSSFFNIALGAYMARHMFDWVSLDATSWRIAAEKKEFFNPFDLSRENLRSSATIDPEIKNDCPCPHCGGISFYQIKEMLVNKRVALLRRHNWWEVDKKFRDLYENSIDVIQLERFLKKRSKRPAEVDKLCNTLSLVEALKDVDTDVLKNLLRPVGKKRKTSLARKQTVSA
jgi:hypothetical protein